MTANDLLRALVQSLHEESDALVAGDTEKLGAAAARKSALIARLGPQLRQVGHGDSDLDRAQLRQAQLLNGSNAQLLSARMLANGARLEALRQAGGGQALYGAGGTVSADGRTLRSRASA